MENLGIIRDRNSYSELVIVVTSVVGTILMLAIFKSCFLRFKRQRNGELELQFLKYS